MIARFADFLSLHHREVGCGAADVSGELQARGATERRSVSYLSKKSCHFFDVQNGNWSLSYRSDPILSDPVITIIFLYRTRALVA